MTRLNENLKGDRLAEFLLEAQPPASMRGRWTKVAREAYDLGLVAREVQREGLGPQPIWQ